MKTNSVGKIKNINYDSETNDLEVLIKIFDNKFKKKLLRDLSLSGHIYFEKNKLIYVDNEDKKD
tara:strand:+ start:140 stop:331 length:192 start_codon:yes stop_codon:yes gene_type:complete